MRNTFLRRLEAKERTCERRSGLSAPVAVCPGLLSRAQDRKIPVFSQHMNSHRILATQNPPGIAVGMEGLRRKPGTAPKGRPTRRFLGFGVLAVLLACLAGCGRHHAPSTRDSAEAGKTSEDPTPALLAELTQLVRKYGAEQRQAPGSLDDLVTRGYLRSVPPAPNGKRFAINKRLEVYLADR